MQEVQYRTDESELRYDLFFILFKKQHDLLSEMISLRFDWIAELRKIVHVW